MGYAVPLQRGTGIHTRLHSRAFIVADDDEKKSFVFVSVDCGMASDIVKNAVVERLQGQFGGLYSHENVAVSGTHTHSGPGGFLAYILYQSTSWGFVKETYDAMVDGIYLSIVQAHGNLQDATIQAATGTLYESNINRSPTSYLLNPQQERDQYPDGDTDKTMLMLRFSSRDGACLAPRRLPVALPSRKQPRLTPSHTPPHPSLVTDPQKLIGALNWFAVHATSMNNTNTLVSSDNKGRASQQLEKELNGPDALPGTGPIVAAFASTNLGDVSPNTVGARCIDTGLPCDGTTSTCDGKCEKCIASGAVGANGDMFESTRIIGDSQAKFASSLLQQAAQAPALTGTVDFRHSFVRMPGLNVSLPDGKTVSLCRAAMGMSFAAGTTDGPGMFNFEQSSTIATPNPFWNKVRDFISAPTAEDKACQAPKPILINTGGMDRPYAWDPSTLPLQLLRVGHVFIVAVPSEFTTMAGRRLRKQLASVLRGMPELGGLEPVVTIAGLANGYSSYVTTPEEYAAQRYEAASTIFGPNTLAAYLQELTRLAKDMVTGSAPSASDPPPPFADMVANMLQLTPEVVFDRVPLGEHWGQVLEQPSQAQYKAGDTVVVKFRSANPRNSPVPGPLGSFLSVDLASADASAYKTKYVDGDWSTKFRWLGGRPDKLALALSAESVAWAEWTVGENDPPGRYRVCHYGAHKALLHLGKGGAVTPFQGCSQDFLVVA